jgi:hypothetical protein
MPIVTNFESFPARWKSASGEEGESAAAFSLGGFLRPRREDAVMVVSCDLRLTLQLAAVFLLLPFLRRPLVSADLVLRRPRRWWHRAALPLQRFLLSRCDYHIHYFRDLRGYRELFGIGPENSSFVPFKANLRHRFATEPSPGGIMSSASAAPSATSIPSSTRWNSFPTPPRSPGRTSRACARTAAGLPGPSTGCRGM